MRRLGRSVRVAVVVCVALAPGASLAQTTTTSSSTTSTSTTATSTTTTTLVHPCTGQPCTDLPPDVVMATSSAQIQADKGSYCWHRAGDPGPFCLAIAVAPGYKPPILVVTEGEVVTVRFTPPAPGLPRQVALLTNGITTSLTAADPTSFRVDLPAAIHENLALRVHWLQGEVTHHFRLDVRRPASPAAPSDGRPIALTG